MIIRPTWDAYFLALASTASTRSTCARRQVGAVLVNDIKHHIVGTGYNGSVPGAGHCIDGHCPRGRKSYDEKPAFTDYGDCIAVHAEMNALKQADSLIGPVSGSAWVMYVTCHPCPDCKAILDQRRIRVVYSW